MESRMSLWTEICSGVPESERDEIKAALGDDLVDQASELKIEIDTLLEIYDAFSKERAAGDNKATNLPEPPELRHRLILEIQFFVQSIRDHARSQGRNPDSVLENHHLDIIDYAYESSSSRPTTSDTSHLSTSRSSCRATPVSERCNVNLMKEKLNYMDFDEVRTNLRQFLQDEVDQLNRDLIELQSSLYQDDISKVTFNNQPTISELKRERHDLEQILLQSSQPVTQRFTHKPTSSNGILPNKQERKRIFKIRPDSEGSTTTRTITSPSRLKPLEPKVECQQSSYEYSPLDLGLPETSSTIQEVINSNNSSINSGIQSKCNSPNYKAFPPTPPLGKLRNFNSAQKFRQKVLQNRKESLDC